MVEEARRAEHALDHHLDPGPEVVRAAHLIEREETLRLVGLERPAEGAHPEARDELARAGVLAHRGDVTVEQRVEARRHQLFGQRLGRVDILLCQQR